MVATLAVLTVLGGCGTGSGNCQTIDDRISELEGTRPPASVWDDVAALQSDIVERDGLVEQRRVMGC